MAALLQWPASRMVLTSPCLRVRQAIPRIPHRLSSTNCFPPNVATPGTVLLNTPEQGITDVDAVIVLAGGLTDDGGCPGWVERRLDGAAEIYRMTGNKCKVMLTGGGTPHKPSVLDSKGYVIHESTSCANYLLANGLDPMLLLKELASHDTVGNAYFSLTSHIIPSGWTKLAVVTSDFHMPRSQQLFQDMLDMAARELFNQPDRYEVHFCPVTDEGIFEPHVLQLRKDKEAKSLEHWRGTRKRLNSLADLHRWLHTEHLCYAVARQHEWGLNTIKDPVLLKSY